MVPDFLLCHLSSITPFNPLTWGKVGRTRNHVNKIGSDLEGQSLQIVFHTWNIFSNIDIYTHMQIHVYTHDETNWLILRVLLGYVNRHRAFFIKQLQPTKQNRKFGKQKAKDLKIYNPSAVWTTESASSLYIVPHVCFTDGFVFARILRFLNSELKVAWKTSYVIHWKTNKEV